ncbi:MAG TPA: class I SAM-dependent methyltransferase [Polyangiaceae bacterium]|nr:class I SAM-dependent methyltransferase [Polyangiaceae bacterium]
MTGSFACRICRAEAENDPIVVREMMFGTRDEFAYYECRACGCLQIASYPENIADYYPKEYYSFATDGGRKAYSRLERFLHHRRANHALGRLDPIGFAASKVFGELEAYTWLKRAGASFDSAILEVGCGTGFLLSLLHRDGFFRLEGVDPFIPDEAREQDGYSIRRTLADARPGADFILLSHSLEHMPNQDAVLGELRRAATPATCLCVRIPLANEAWRRFGPDWGQIDAPRHFYLHTPKSFRLLAARHGFDVVDTIFDSTALQFWWSEQNRRDVPLNDAKSHAGPHGALFSPAELSAWEREARALNQRGQGDQATFLLRPSPARASG